MPRCGEILRSGRMCNKIFSCKSCHDKVYHTPGFKWPPEGGRYVDASSWPTMGSSPISDEAWAQPGGSYPIDPQVLAADESGR